MDTSGVINQDEVLNSECKQEKCIYYVKLHVSHNFDPKCNMWGWNAQKTPLLIHFLHVLLVLHIVNDPLLFWYNGMLGDFDLSTQWLRELPNSSYNILDSIKELYGLCRLDATNMADFPHHISSMTHDPDLYTDCVPDLTSLLPAAILSCSSTTNVCVF